MLPQSNLSIGTIQYPISEIARYIPTPRSVALREVKGEIYYQVLPQEGKARYFHTISGAEIDLDASYAMQIASNYLPKKKLKHAAYLSSFDGEYLNIFRALPVYRIDVDDESGERIYVSTNTGSVTLYLNNIRAFGQHSFSTLHKLSFIPNKTIRDVVQVILVLMIVATTIMGLIIGLRR
jgi:hypothetical protein